MTGSVPVAARHSREEFNFVARGPYDVAWPLFGAQGERAWAPGWDPQFVWPAEAVDREGMVFTVTQGGRTAVWINTVFDLASGKIQYVYVIPDVVATVISLRLVSLGDSTRVSVTYERSALCDSATELVGQMAERDKAAGEEWSRQIATHLRARKQSLEGSRR